MENISGKNLIRNTWLEIDLDKVKTNIKRAQELIGRDTKLAGVVKANAYGHGALQIGKTMIEEGVDILAVAFITEGLELRKEFKDVAILIMGYTEDQNLELALKNNLTLTIFSLDQARLISKISKNLGKEALIHVKIDTGMNRLGLKPGEETIRIIEEIWALENLKIQGIFSHLALKDQEEDREQYRKFMNLIRELESRNINIPIKHICDGIGMVEYPDMRLDMVRVGSYLLGAQPAYADRKSTRPALAFKTKIVHIKEIEKGEGVSYDHNFVAKKRTRVGTLPIGYGDGYLRSIEGRGQVSVLGRRAPIIGRICMDQMMIDLSQIPQARVGDVVALIEEGPLDNISLIELGDYANTNRNEIIAGISRRVPRVYIKNKKIIDIVDPLLD